MRCVVFMASPMSAISFLMKPSSPTTTGPQCRPARKSARKAEIAFVSGAALGEAVESGKAGPDAARFVCTRGELPAGDDLIADIFVDFSASSKMDSDRSVTKR